MEIDGVEVLIYKIYNFVVVVVLWWGLLIELLSLGGLINLECKCLGNV